MKKRICTICARGGSKDVPNKNIRVINGKPLIAYTLKLAKKSSLFDEIVVSSDSEEILNISNIYGASLLIKRPEGLSQDKSAKIPAIRHCWEESELILKKKFDYLIDLDATSPLRILDDLKGSIEHFESEKADNLITGCISKRSPFFNMVKLENKKYARLYNETSVKYNRRQDTPDSFDMNASIYIWSRKALLQNNKLFFEKTLFFEMPEERSYDIDSEIDFKIVEMMLNEKIR